MDRADRLELLLRVLRDRPGITADEVAQRLGTSRRSVSRDVARLRERGYPIEASRGRGGGLRLHPSFGLGRVQLSPEQAVGALLSVAIGELLPLPLFWRDLGAVRTKIVAAFPEAERRRLKALRERIIVGPAASPEVASSYGRVERESALALQSAFVRERVLEVGYVRGDGERSTRIVEPHVILLNWPAWYLLAHDRTREDVRTFRLDRMGGARERAEGFTPRARGVIRAIGGAEFADADRWSL